MQASPQVLSASSIGTFLRCEQQWYYAYVLKLKRPPSIRQSIGLAAHSSVEHNMTQKIMSHADEPVDVVLDVFSTEYDTLMEEAEEEPVKKGKGKDTGLKSVRQHHRVVAPTIQPIMVEQPVQFAINSIPYTGYVDLVDDTDRVRDNKFVGRKPNSINLQYVIGMTGYALAFRQLTGRNEREVVLDFMVQTKQPYYLPIPSKGPIDDAAIGVFAKVVDTVYKRIAKGDFLPTGISHQACGWCGYRQMCPAYRAIEGDENGSDID